MTQTVLIGYSILLQTQNDYHGKMKLLNLKLRNAKYTTNFPVTINNNKTVSLFDMGATIYCMLKACFEKLEHKPT